MAELRYDPISREWVMVASYRQSRPQMPADWCPFCPGSGKVPDAGYDVMRYLNDFPALSQSPPEPDDVATDVFQTARAYGRCEVLLYSDRHTATLGDLDDEHIKKLANMWRECFVELSADERVKYVFIFENRGEQVGVTMPHPHGQVYAYPYLPPKLEREVLSAREYHIVKGGNLFLSLLDEEKRVGTRIIARGEHFTVYVPFYSRIAYGVHVTANRPVADISEMTDAELGALGVTLRDCARMYDGLFGFPFPYMMCMHNAPVNSGDFTGVFQFHVEFFPPLRARDKQQFFASSETGAGAFCNPTSPEEKAAEMREAYLASVGAR
ncbi:MAG: galactose-1-phosphate uridylyltransferase [Oscillospiraceae bacterium]|nr:galactose-1-phosphate uridylyltransferase [Oscillospiraceae bacterium]